MVRSPSWRPLSSTATIVWVRLGASTPRRTMKGVLPFLPDGEGHGSAGGHIPVRGDATLLSSHAGRPFQARRAAQRTVATKAENTVERTHRTPTIVSLGSRV